MENARSLLNRSNEIEPEKFCDEVHSLASAFGKPEPIIINRKYKLVDRRGLAFAVLLALLHKNRVYGGSILEKEKKETSTALVVTDQNDYYALLGVDKNASQKEIELAYKERSHALDTETLESALRTQGLSNEEIKIRLEQAQRDFENLREAYSGIGNEENRRHYDNFRNKYKKEGSQQDQKQKTYSRARTVTSQQARNWEILGLGPNPTQSEIKASFRKLSKELHPDAYRGQTGKNRVEDLSPEEFKEYSSRAERLKEVNLAFHKLSDPEQLRKEKAEANKAKEQKQSPEKQNNVVIETTPTVPETETSQKALEKTEKFRRNVKIAGYLTYTPEETAELKSVGVVPDTSSSEEVSANTTTALQLHSMGVKAEEFSNKVDSSEFLESSEKTSLQNTAFTMESLEIKDPEQSNSLNIGNREPTVSIKQIPESVTTTQPNQLILQPQGGGFFKPLLEQTLDIAKGQAEKFTLKALEKTGLGTAKGAVKKFATESLKKGGKELATKIGSKIAVKLGLSAVGATLSGGTTLLLQAAAWVASKILRPLIDFAKKALSGILRFITGKDDLKSQLKELSGIALVASLAMGAVVPAVISGGIFLTTLGAGSIIAGVTGAFSVFISIVTSTVLVISTPLIISVFVFIFLVIFIIIIINNSAFVVPYGGFNIPPPGTIIGENPYIKVSKLARSTQPFRTNNSYQTYENSDLSPLTVTYTIEITALQDNLTNVNIQYNCHAQSESIPNLNCPTNPTIPSPPGGEISAGDNYTFSYTQEYSSTYEDSFVSDTIIVSARTSEGSTQTSSSVAAICIGSCPQNCPFGWPVATGYVTQGPDGTFSHTNCEAIDISGCDLLPVYSTHAGTVEYHYNTCEGTIIQVRSVCNGILFASRYSHLAGRSVADSSFVSRGTVIGFVDNTGFCTTGSHLHYEFRGGLRMEPPFIPVEIDPRDCDTRAECNVNIP